MSSPSDAVVNFPADEDLSRSLLEDKENVVTSVSAVQEIVSVEEVLVQEVSVVEIVGTGATAVSDVGSGVVTAPEDGVSLVEVGAHVGTGVDNTPSVSDIAYSELADMQSADIAAAIEPVSVLEVVPAAAVESAVSLEEDDDHRVLTSEALPTKEDITFVDPSIVPESLPFEEIPPDDTIPLHAMADPSIAADVIAAAEDDERTAQEVQKAEELGAVTAEIVKDDEKKEEQETTVVRVVEESVSVLQTRVIVEEVVPSTGEVLAQNVTESTIVDRETMTETALPQAAAGIVDGCAIAFTGEKEETMAVEETAVKKRSRDEIFVSEEARALAEQLPVAAADAVDEALALAVAGEEGDVPAVKRVKSDAAAGGEVEADVEQNNGSSKAVDDTQMGEEHTGDVEQGGGADSLQQEEAGKEEEQMPAAELKLGPKLFLSSIELFSYLYDLLHGWVVNTDLNKVSSFLNFQFYNAANDVWVEAK
jgi:hypothetical protein